MSIELLSEAFLVDMLSSRRDFVMESGLTSKEARQAYPHNHSISCTGPTCVGDVQWIVRSRRGSDGHVVDIYPGDEYCFSCGDLHPDFYPGESR